MTTKRKLERLKQDLHRLVDELPDSELFSAKRFLEHLRNMGDPLVRKLMEAPYSDPTEEELAALDEAYEDIAARRILSHEEVRRRLLEES